jgi:hypothetical protein
MRSVEVAEAFHLAFLTVLAVAADPRTFALKGGGNLRLYFSSLRYSEDIDLDVFANDPRMFSQKVERAFGSPNLAKLLATLGIKVTYLNPKDRTSTKEKWVMPRLPAWERPSAGRAVPPRVSSSTRLSSRLSSGGSAYARFRRRQSVTASLVVPSSRRSSPSRTARRRSRRRVRPDHLFRMFPAAPAKSWSPSTSTAPSRASTRSVTRLTARRSSPSWTSVREA